MVRSCVFINEIIFVAVKNRNTPIQQDKLLINLKKYQIGICRIDLKILKGNVTYVQTTIMESWRSAG